MTKQEILIIILIVILVAGNIFFAGKYLYTLKELNATKKITANYKVNTKILNFFKLFISEVLRSDNEISFETRLRLENTVRDTGNKEILTEWQKFIGSQNEFQAQENVKDLLESLIDSIQVK